MNLKKVYKNIYVEDMQIFCDIFFQAPYFKQDNFLEGDNFLRNIQYILTIQNRPDECKEIVVILKQE